ncbi:MAG: hypothetical protein B6D59_00355 [Campylobacteraceae bacterium 4484_4]|nr:MAG: hypothetical protein B6D59_00355 [Campylobacteraceae bacterium 4484_4]
MFMEEDDLFGGTPEKKYFDIIFNANRNLVEGHLRENLDRIAALEMLLEEMLGEDKDVDQIIRNFIFQHQDEIAKRRDNLYIIGMGDILTQNE